MADLDDSSAVTTTSNLLASSSGGKKKESVRCVLDSNLVNEDTFPLMKDPALSIFASACSKNRGAFVLDPPDGNTYGCLALPSNVLERVGIDADADGNNRALKELEEEEEEEVKEEVDDDEATNAVSTALALPRFTVTKAEDIMTHYKDGNLTSGEAVKLLDFVVTNVYRSTPNVELNPYACDTNGLVTLECDNEKATIQTDPVIRAVTMAGVFTPALWATNGQELTLDQATDFYTLHDFKEMKKLGLNTIQIPVPTKLFSPRSPEKHAKWKSLLMDILQDIGTVGDLKVVLVLDATDSPVEDLAGSVQEAVLFANDHTPLIVAITLPSTTDDAILEAATTALPADTTLKIWVPIKGGDFKSLSYLKQRGADGASLELSHTSTVADKASSTSQEDRAKLFYHESIACIARAPLEYGRCYQNDMPVLVAQGFDLAIDDCHLRGLPSSSADLSKDYGQCNRFNETIDSPWWRDHRFSFAARQLFAYEKGHGWSFATWKLYNSQNDKEEEEQLGILDTPAKLLAFREVVAAGLMPSLLELDQPITFPLDTTNQSSSASTVGLACLNPPNNDFVLGDATLAPTPAPPPNCGNGWWNFTTEQCDYWIPPTAAPCPVCSSATNDTATIVVTEPVDCPEILPSDAIVAEGSDTHEDQSNSVAIKSFLAGAVVSALVCMVVFKLLGESFGNRRRRDGYESVANGNGNGYHTHGNGNQYQNGSIGYKV